MPHYAFSFSPESEPTNKTETAPETQYEQCVKDGVCPMCRSQGLNMSLDLSDALRHKGFCTERHYKTYVEQYGPLTETYQSVRTRLFSSEEAAIIKANQEKAEQLEAQKGQEEIKQKAA